jgi:uncharacterized protein YlaI
MTKADTGTRVKGEMSLDKVLKLVQKAIAIAEHPGTDPTEAKHSRDYADNLMRTYAIQEAEARMAMPVSERAQPGQMEFSIGGYSDISWLVSAMANRVARHCRLMVRGNARYDIEDREYLNIAYGFKSDLQYFQMLYTTLRLHMLGALLPGVDPSLSLDDNCYRLHNAGYNWLEIAEMYGWRKASFRRVREYADEHDSSAWDIKVPYFSEELGELAPATRVGGIFKRAYYRACKVRGETPKQIPAGGSSTYRESAARAYVNRITERLRELETGRKDEPGVGVALRSSMEDVQAYFRRENPDLFEDRPAPEPCPRCAKNPSGHCRDHPRGRAWAPRPHSAAGWAAGVAQANSADLNGSNKASGSSTHAIG